LAVVALLAATTAGGVDAVELSPGLHEILLEAQLSPLRRPLLAVDLGLLCLAAYVLLRHRGR
jgi:hypothetical protein